MFNLIMITGEFGAGPLTLGTERIFEYTENHIINQYTINGSPDFQSLIQLPCIFMHEGTEDQLCYVGRVTRVQTFGRDYLIDHVIDHEIRPITNAEIYEKRIAYRMNARFEFGRNHWAIKEADLFRLLLTHSYPNRQNPKVFDIPAREKIETDLLSVMMPFEARFDNVYEDIKAYAEGVFLRCHRADDIWNHDAIIQDVVSLIDRSRFVICDCSGRNANVFYEAGIAHTLGRDVILITQNGGDVPFDLQHLRYISYLNNDEGRQRLIGSIRERIANLANR